MKSRGLSREGSWRNQKGDAALTRNGKTVMDLAQNVMRVLQLLEKTQKVVAALSLGRNTTTAAQREDRAGWIPGVGEPISGGTKQGTVAAYQWEFEIMATPLKGISDKVMESTFMNGLLPEIQVELSLLQPYGLGHLMEMAQRAPKCLSSTNRDEEEDYNQFDDRATEEPTLIELKDDVELSLNSVVGLTTSGTMKIKRTIGNALVGDLRRVKVNWKMLTMKIKMGKVVIVLKGDPTLSRTKVSLEAIARALQHHSQGFRSGLENKATDALSHIPISMELAALMVPNRIDTSLISSQVEADPHLAKIKQMLLDDPDAYPRAMLAWLEGIPVPADLQTTHERFLWVGMKNDIKEFVEKCLVCQQNKTLTLSPAGLLQPLPIPDKIWDDVTMDFIEGLPKFGAQTVATIFVRDVVKLHGFPRSIISDRDKYFLADFGRSYFGCRDTGIITTFHSSTNTTPFRAVYGRDPPPLIRFGSDSTSVLAVDQLLQERDLILNELKDHLCCAQSKMKSSADAHHRAVQFEVGDFVYIKLRLYCLCSLAKRPNEKLFPRYFGPYKVVQQIGPVAYRLEFPSSTTIHPMFHVSQLKRALGSADLCQPLSLILVEDLEWLVEPDQVLDIRQSPNNNQPGIEVLIQWKGLPQFEASWESVDTIKEQFPDFHLEDKVSLIEGSNDRPPIRYVYNRKGKRNILHLAVSCHSFSGG
ncbi:hypothetical protein CK203_085924 [Vitis vinifera]|uniref:Chromo domain-containing protein n=1 Tax=Vitis vinifera TaxID=29760 RepID=A0A438DI10_VITVI|nr:hypothetical protein CK203_085924 [Vitis vinifera]